MRENGIVSAAPVPLSLTGVVRSPDDRPVPGATVYLVSEYLTDQPLAEAKTDATGRYQFQNVPLPTLQFERSQEPQGRFQLIAEADGFGLAWHGSRSYLATNRPANEPVDPQDSMVYASDRTDLNLVMERPKNLEGRIVDDQGQPVANATVLLRDLDYLKTENREMHENSRQCNCIVVAPPDYCETITDSEGRFRFPNLPEGCVAFLRISHDDFAEQWLYVAMTDERVTEYRYISNHTTSYQGDENGDDFRPLHTPIWSTRSVHTCPVTIQARSARRIQVTLTQPNGKPTPKGTTVVASAGSESQQDYSSGETDQNGQLRLTLPPGTYTLMARPPRYSNLRTSRATLQVNSDPGEQQFTMALAEGCVLHFEVLDAKTGKGIAGVHFTENMGNGSHQGLSNETTRLDFPVTDANGRLRAVVFPGTRRYQLNYVAGYVIDFAEAEVTCEPGKATHIQFKLQPEK